MNGDNMRARVTKRMLMEGLIRCLKHTGIDKLSVSELCREAGVNRATFYNHYGTPRDILEEMGREYASEIKKIFEADSGLPIKDRIANCLDILYDNKEQVRIILNSGSDQQITDVESDIFMWFWGHVGDVIKRLGIKDETDYELLASAFCMGTYHLITKWIIEDIQKTPQEMADLLMTVTAGIFGPF